MSIFSAKGTGVCDYRAFRERSGRYDFVALNCIDSAAFLPILKTLLQSSADGTVLPHCLGAGHYLLYPPYRTFLIMPKRVVWIYHAEPELLNGCRYPDLCSYLGINRQTLFKSKQLLTEGR